MSDRLKLKASLAVLIVDDYTDKVISGSQFSVSIENGGKPIRKEEGYYVFTNLNHDKVHLRIESIGYIPVTMWVDLSQLDPREPLLKVRLYPNHQYALREGTTVIQGKALPLCDIWMTPIGPVSYFRLMNDYSKKTSGESLILFNPEGIDIEEKWFMIVDKEDVIHEALMIKKITSEDKTSCLLREPLKNDYKKVGTKLIPVSRSHTDDKGAFFMPLANKGTTKYLCECFYDGQSILKREINISQGKINYEDLQ